MLNLKVRKPDFNFTGDTPFQWHPENPRFATSLNASSFFAVGFERFVVRTMRDAMPHITDPDIQREARLFQAQEGQHGYAHKLHIDSMIRLYPNLKATHEKVGKHFDALYDNKSLKFRLAYVANLESTFPPVMNFMIENRESLFSKGRKNMASLFLWHAVEETEHRGSASTIYNHIAGNQWYRLAKLPGALMHLAEFNALIRREFVANIPLSDRTGGIDTPPKPFACVPFGQRMLLAIRLAQGVLPWHDSDNEKPPQWFNEWMQADSDGVDMATFYGR
jgi:predicted metal-dependent hydrolase